MTDQDTINAARIFIAARIQRMGPGELADALADAGMLADPKCQRECEALRDWDALLAERDAAVAKLDQARLLHSPSLVTGKCRTCKRPWPCETRRILDREAQS